MQNQGGLCALEEAFLSRRPEVFSRSRTGEKQALPRLANITHGSEKSSAGQGVCVSPFPQKTGVAAGALSNNSFLPRAAKLLQLAPQASSRVTGIQRSHGKARGWKSRVPRQTHWQGLAHPLSPHPEQKPCRSRAARKGAGKPYRSLLHHNPCPLYCACPFLPMPTGMFPLLLPGSCLSAAPAGQAQKNTAGKAPKAGPATLSGQNCCRYIQTFPGYGHLVCTTCPPLAKRRRCQLRPTFPIIRGNENRAKNSPPEEASAITKGSLEKRICTNKPCSRFPNSSH